MRERKSRLELEADALLRAAVGDADPQQWFRDAGIVTDSREKTHQRRELDFSAVSAVGPLLYSGEGWAKKGPTLDTTGEIPRVVWARTRKRRVVASVVPEPSGSDEVERGD